MNTNIVSDSVGDHMRCKAHLLQVLILQGLLKNFRRMLAHMLLDCYAMSSAQLLQDKHKAGHTLQYSHGSSVAA